MPACPLLLALAACLLAAVPMEAQTITLDALPAYGSANQTISGKVTGVDPTKYKVAPFIFVSGLGTYSKPNCPGHTVALSANGSFSANLFGGGVDNLASRISLLVVPANTDVRCVAAENGVPDDLRRTSIASLFLYRPDPEEREVTFARGKWAVKGLPGTAIYPGPCVFSNSASNVFADASGLHLRLIKTGNTWTCAEVYSRSPVGYGRTAFTIANFPALGSSVVLGAFFWVDGEPEEREIDFEIGFPSTGNAQFAVNPLRPEGLVRRISIPQSGPVTIVMTWMPGSLKFEAFAGTSDTGTPLEQWQYPATPPVADSTYQNFRFNLWINGIPPSDSQTEEVVVSDFDYQPAATSLPLISAALNAGGYLATASRGGAVAIFGSRLSSQAPAPAPSLPLTQTLAGSNVRVSGITAGLYYSSASQINIQIPGLTPPGPGLVSVTANGVEGLKFPIFISTASPGIFSLPSGCIAQNEDFSLNDAQHPAKAGSVAIVYLTGIGPVSNPPADGAPAGSNPLARATSPFIGSTLGNVEFLGLVPGLVGLGQANIRIPAGTAAGAKDVTITVAGNTSNFCAVYVGN